ncbi:peptidoglycan D,D-transpeptidase FtsI family protein [Arcanobacterium hippocoleae]|uniref:peptidoglycan D,D-transpeptidase FtsI family protein n=1 Tax=Arcanobacterium hippocoleae TaxID=149017 RepID=UPI00333FCDBE
MQDRKQNSSRSADPMRLARATTHKRLRAVIAIVLVMAILLVGRLIVLQAVHADALAKTAHKFRARNYQQQALRGNIVDNAGAVLASSVPHYNLRVDQKAIQDFQVYDEQDQLTGTGAAAAAKILAPLLKLDEAELAGELHGGKTKNQFALIKAGLSVKEMQEIEKLAIHGIFGERYMERVYPNGALAGAVLGFVGRTAESDKLVGRAGIEQKFEDVLSGTDGSLQVEVGPDGTIFPNAQRNEVEPQDGRTVKLTIDRDLQQVTEDALRESIQKHGSDWGSAVVLETHTGRVLAMADTMAYDPNNVGKQKVSSYTANSIGAVIEPGSTGKTITMASAIDLGKINPYTPFVTASTFTTPEGEIIKDYAPHATAKTTVAAILAHSYNTGTVQIGMTMDRKTRYEYLQAFGTGQRTGIELPAEEAGILNDYRKWDQRTNYTTMFGQGYAVTPLQLAVSANIFGSGGVAHPVHIVDGIYEKDGRYQPTVPGTPKQVISPESAKTMLNLMHETTKDGAGGTKARVPNYNVAGKTGTAEVINAAGQLVAINGTYIGLIPAEDPKIAVAVVAHTPGGNGYGEVISAPVFAKLAQFAMRKMGVPPSSQTMVDYPWIVR